MRPLALAFGLALCTVVACSGGTDSKAASATTASPRSAPQRAAAGEVLRLRRYDIVDQTGFERPMPAISFLAPVGWKLEGGVQWNPEASCLIELVSVQARVQSPDGRRAFEIFPKYMSQWVDEPQLNQMMSASQLCRSAPPFQSAEFVAQAFVPGFRSGARVLGSEARPKAAEAQRQKTMAIEGNDIRRLGIELSVDACQSRIAYDSQAGPVNEWVLAISSISRMAAQGLARMDGSQAYSLWNIVENPLCYRAPAAELDADERLFATILGTYRIDPAWEQLVGSVMKSVNEVRVQGALDNIAALRQQSRRIFNDWNASIDQRDADWKRRMADQDRVQRELTEAIRGTETFADPYDSSTSWQLPNDYEFVWKTVDDEFLLTNDANFDPNADENKWERMKARP